MKEDNMMSDNTSRTRILAVAACLALLMCGCGSASGGPGATPTASGSSNTEKEVAYADCMHSHGVQGVSVSGGDGITIKSPGNSGGTGGSGGQSVPPSQFTSAMDACRHLLPNGGQLSQTQQAQNLKRQLAFAQCMRSHGVPDYPDPSSNGSSSISVNGNSSSDLNPSSPRFQKAQQDCQSLVPGGGAP
jgi:hypothetical protein